MSQIFISVTKDEFQDMIRDGINSVLNKEAGEAKDLKAQQEFLTVQEACALLRISKPTLYKRMEDGTIPVKRMGSRVLFDRAELIESVKKQGGK